MDKFTDTLKVAVEHHKAGRLFQAEVIYRRVLQRQPEHPQALRLLGDIARRVAVPTALPSPIPCIELLPFLAECAGGPVGKSSTTEQIVLGIAFNYEAPKVAPFIRSLREHYSGEVLIFVDEPRLAPFLEQYGIRFQVWDKATLKTHIVLLRYAMYLRFLAQNSHEYRDVLLADVGDVVFQADPFDIEGDPALVSFQEDREFTIGNQPINARWVANCFGDEGGLEILKDKPIVCSGVTLGRIDKILSYLRLMLAIASMVRQDRVELFGYDQAIHNFIAHLGLIDGFEIRENYGHCTHLGLS